MEEKKRKSIKRGVTSSTIDTKTKIIKINYVPASHSSDGIEYFCPECGRKYTALAMEFWIQCDHCKEWYHGDCVSVESYQADELDHFYCHKCEHICGKSTNKPITNEHRHNRCEINPPPTIQSGTKTFVKNLVSRTFPSAESEIKNLSGTQLTVAYLLREGFDIPILVQNKKGLDIMVPDKSFSVADVMDLIGADFQLDVIDSRRQLSIKMPMVKFFRLMQSEERPSVYNCISLEVSQTKMSSMIRAPAIVNKISWVDQAWPDCPQKPRVGKYCLMSMAGSYTDFHIDFGGTSVWYHVLKGEKIFYLIEPTTTNLQVYERWMNRHDSCDVFLPDIITKIPGSSSAICKTIVLREGNTLLLPTGWIHAVLTIEDSIVFGGNFLHSLNIPLQMEIYEMENRIKTPDKFLFPFFELTNWFAAAVVVIKLFKDHFANKPPPRLLLDGLESLCKFLRKWQLQSKEENSSKNGDYSTFAPKGILNTKNILKELNFQLRSAHERIAKINAANGAAKREKHTKSTEESPTELDESEAKEHTQSIGTQQSNGSHTSCAKVEAVAINTSNASEQSDVDEFDGIKRFLLCSGS